MMKRTVCVGGIVLLAAIVLVAMAGVGGPLHLPRKKFTGGKCQVHWPTASVSYKDSAEVVVNRPQGTHGGEAGYSALCGGGPCSIQGNFQCRQKGHDRDCRVASSVLPGPGAAGSCRIGTALQLQGSMGMRIFLQVAWFRGHAAGCLCQARPLLLNGQGVCDGACLQKNPFTKWTTFKGLKLRSSGVLQLYLTAIGAAASYIPGSEIYPSLASGRD